MRMEQGMMKIVTVFVINEMINVTVVVTRLIRDILTRTENHLTGKKDVGSATRNCNDAASINNDVNEETQDEQSLVSQSEANRYVQNVLEIMMRLNGRVIEKPWNIRFSQTSLNLSLTRCLLDVVVVVGISS